MTSTADKISVYRNEFIKSAIDAGALKFGSFTLKSGRISPYFFNSGMLNDGAVLAKLASAFAALISASNLEFDVLFGPAYKGISLAAVTTVALANETGRSVGFAYNRKEAKDHGEGGMHVGASLKDKRVLMLDDVFTSGKAIREAASGIVKEGGTIVGVVLILDREEIGKEGETDGAKVVIERELGAPVSSVLGVQDLIVYLESTGATQEVALMKEYREKYGIKSA
ncbi:orotate phosphoribosyltransferase [Clavulina sp. PMI_390]|nr:orotate phosphoribosyltransferase [Clavulina sp. PMI_390]